MDALAVYLHDHRAGPRFAVELLEKLASEFAGTPSGHVVRELSEQVLTDRSTLDQLISRAGKGTPGLYDTLGWIAERLSRIRLEQDEPAGIGAFEAFETISLGLPGKSGPWGAHGALDKRETRR